MTRPTIHDSNELYAVMLGTHSNVVAVDDPAVATTSVIRRYRETADAAIENYMRTQMPNALTDRALKSQGANFNRLSLAIRQAANAARFR